MASRSSRRFRGWALAPGLWLALFADAPAPAQTLEDPKLSTTIVASGLTEPVSMAFLGPGDFLVLEKAGTVRRVLNGVLLPSPVLDVIVNASSERGLLGIAINTETPRKVFLFYTEALTQDGEPLGNRVYRYTWNAADGVLEDPLLLLDLPCTPASGHNGGALLLGPPGQAPGVGDGSLLYVVIGDLGRFGQLQNVFNGPTPDDTSVILRVRQDGTPAPGNPFTPWCAGATTLTCDEQSDCGGNGPCVLEAARYYAYGVRNSFGLALDPVTGDLWDTENGPNEFDEVNRVTPGLNSGWFSLMGPDALDPQGLADTWDVPGAGSTYSDPEFSWTLTIAPTAIVFPYGSNLGDEYDDKAIVGDFNQGSLHALPLAASRTAFDFSAHPNLTDLVADNWDERDELSFGTGFGGAADLEIGPDGALYVVNLSGTVHRITGPIPVPGLPVPALGALAVLLAGSAVFAVRRRRWAAACLLAAALGADPARAQVLNDPNLSFEPYATGLSVPTAMAFLGPNDILVLEKSGRVRRVINGVVQPNPVLTVIVNASSERGLLGIAINTESPPRVFLFYTEALTQDGAPLGNRVYRYTWNAGASQLQSPQLLLDLAVNPGSNHNGGTLALGPPGQAPGVGDGALLYAVVGDVNRFGQLQNNRNGDPPDDSSVILRVRQDGTPAPGNPFAAYCTGATSQSCNDDGDCGGNGPCRLEVERYFGYGVRNSFGMALDPLTGRLWNTENGPNNYDEVNRVAPGFNSGWMRIMGPIALDGQGLSDVFDMPGAGSTYSDPELTWLDTNAPTAIVFPVGSSLGAAYDVVALVADFNDGAIHSIPLDASRNAFDFSAFPTIQNRIITDDDQRDLLIIGTDFGGGITDLKIGPDDHLYLTTVGGTIFRIRGPGPGSGPPPSSGRKPARPGLGDLGTRLGEDAAELLGR